MTITTAQRREEIKHVLLAHLQEKLTAFWEDVQSSDFLEGRNVVVSFVGWSDDVDQRILRSATEHLNIVSPLIAEYCLEESYKNRFSEMFLKQAREYVEDA